MGIIYLTESTLFNDGGDYILTEHLYSNIRLDFTMIILNNLNNRERNLIMAVLLSDRVLKFDFIAKKNDKKIQNFSSIKT